MNNARKPKAIAKSAKSPTTTEQWKFRENWDFEWIENGEVAEACFAYEFGKHVPSFLQNVTWRAAQPDGVDSSGNIHCWLEDYSNVCDKDDPCARYDLIVPKDYPAMSFPAFGKYVHAKKETPAIREMTREEIKIHFGSKKEASMLNDLECLNGAEVIKWPFKNVAFEIVPWVPKTVIMEAFREWLDKNIPDNLVEKQSGKDKRKLYVSMLKKLGAYRLLKVFSVAEAQLHVKRESSFLFENAQDWSTAKSEVRQILFHQFNTMVCKDCGVEMTWEPNAICACGNEVAWDYLAEKRKAKRLKKLG